MTKARKLADLGNVYDDGALSNRNLIINGAMQVAQRGTSASVTDGTNEGYSTVDRFNFRFGNNAGGAATLSQSTDAPTGFSKSLKFDVTTAATSYTSGQHTILTYYIEAQDLRNSGWDYTDASEYLTLSFWVKSNKTGTYCLSVNTPDVSGNFKFIKEWSVDASSTWERKTIKIPGHASLVIDDNNDRGLELEWNLATASDRDNATDNTWWTTDGSRTTSNQVNFFDTVGNELYITGVQLEVGDTATPFEHRSYGDELARCQRYCQLYGEDTTVAGIVYNNDKDHYFPFNFPEMRAKPSVTFSDQPTVFANNSNGQKTVTSGGSNNTNTRSMRLESQGINIGSAGQASWFQMGASGSYFLLEAEL
jgi:hypothetical protein